MNERIGAKFRNENKLSFRDFSHKTKTLIFSAVPLDYKRVCLWSVAFEIMVAQAAVREYVGKIQMRFCITYDELIKYEDNYFGKSIIKNARIMSLDSLDRFLLDGNASDWFLRTMFGIENIDNVDQGGLRVLCKVAQDAGGGS